MKVDLAYGAVLVGLPFFVGLQVIINKSHKTAIDGLQIRLESQLANDKKEVTSCPDTLHGLKFSHSTSQRPYRSGVDTAMLSCFYKGVAE